MGTEPVEVNSAAFNPGRITDLQSNLASTSSAELLARMRAVGATPAHLPHGVVAAAATAAAAADRQLIEVDDPSGAGRFFVLGWADGAAPDHTQHPSAQPRTLSPVPYLVWGACLAAAWPDPTSAPYPGEPFYRSEVIRTCIGLGAHDDAVVRAVDRSLPQAGLITASGAARRLGPAAAALPATVWSALSRFHDRLPRPSTSSTPPQRSPIEPRAAGQATSIRAIQGPPLGLPGVNESIVRSCVTVLEMTRGAVARADLPALLDPAVRRATDQVLAAFGRILITTPEGNWTSGYAEVIADSLVEARIGILEKIERGVLALVLLRTVAIPRAHGRHRHDHWAVTTRPTTLDELSANRLLTRAQIREGIRGLRAAGYVAETKPGHYVPGPALQRISATRAASLWEDLVLLGRPDGHMAAKILARREQLRPAVDSLAETAETPDRRQA